MSKPTITLAENYNQKLGSSFLIHIMQPARKAVPDILGQPVTLKCGDLQFDYELYDYHRDELANVPVHICMSSYGSLTRDEFFDLMYKTYGIHSNSMCGVYFFVRAIENPGTDPQ